MEGFGNLAGIILNGCQVFLGDGHRRDDAGGVTGVDTGKFHVFHHGRDVNVFAVGERIGFAFQSVVEEAVDEERTIRGHAHGLCHVFAEHGFVVDDFHAAATENEARADHHRVATDLLDASEGFVDIQRKTLWGVPAHICAVGLYFMGCPVHSVPAQPHKTKPYSRKHQDETARKSSPQGVTIPNAKKSK